MIDQITKDDSVQEWSHGFLITEFCDECNVAVKRRAFKVSNTAGPEKNLGTQLIAKRMTLNQETPKLRKSQSRIKSW
jgi:hypothetical protein